MSVFTSVKNAPLSNDTNGIEELFQKSDSALQAPSLDYNFASTRSSFRGKNKRVHERDPSKRRSSASGLAQYHELNQYFLEETKKYTEKMTQEERVEQERQRLNTSHQQASEESKGQKPKYITPAFVFRYVKLDEF